jgi:hypothetical protein
VAPRWPPTWQRSPSSRRCGTRRRRRAAAPSISTTSPASAATC